MTFRQLVEEAGYDERCDSELAKRIVNDYLLNWKEYRSITAKTIWTSFPINKNTARKAYRLLKELRKDLVFPRQPEPAIYIYVCHRCKETTWSASNTPEFEDKLCSACERSKISEVKNLPEETEEELSEEETSDEE